MKPQDFHAFTASIFAPMMDGRPTTAAEMMAANVDTLGTLRSVIADLTKKADQLRAELEEAGLTEIEGQHYRASFAQVTGRALTDWEAIAARFKPSAQLIRAYTKTSKASTRLNLTARKLTH